MREKCRRSTCHGHHILTAVITIIGLLTISQLVNAANLRCCTHANGSCRSVCEQISLVTLATDPKELEISLQKLNDLCPKSLMLAFWSCMNETLEEIDKGSGWIGRPCCGIPQSEKCKMACLQAQALSDLTLSCRKSDEIAFFNCIEKQEVGKTCCKNAQFNECREACKNIFRETSTSSKVARDEFHKHCSQDNPRIQQCIHTYISVTPADNPSRNMDCCEKSPNLQCRISCKEALRTETTDQDIIEALTRNGCGNPLPQDRLWQCFLINSAANEPGGSVIQSEKVGMDSAKLQCCFLAATINCQRLCIETFSNQWTSSWSDFDRICQYQLAESEMIKCLTEVDEPCELGCQGMKYCSNFNYRPTELFRNCEQRADKAAEQDFEQWKNGVIRLPMMQIPVLKITACQPEVWKAIACALQIKPCHHEAHINRICKSDCIAILSHCVDRSRLKPNENPITLCEILSPPGNDTPCISLSPYLIESKNSASTTEVTHPCKPDSCNQNSVCMVERNCQIGQPCRAHVCVQGCRMGDMSQMIVPRNSYVRLPSNSHGPHCPGCHMVCYCNHESVLEDCMSQPELGKEDCFHEGKLYKHDTQFMTGCKTCFCYDGEVTCSPKQCGSGLPCHCQDHYVPVCGANGKTYPSACLARCVGLTDDQFEFGACYDSDPCSPNSCHPYHRCVPKKRVCLSIRHRSCKQYDCVNMQNNCNQLPKSAVCDTDNVEHPNICWMLQRRKTLAYYGKCMSHCRGRGLVCGHNGETYASECAAWAERVSVDYKGACAAVGSRYGKHSRCGGIKCPPLPSEHCTKVFPPGGCCPICGASLRLLYSQKLSDWSVEAVRTVNPVVIQTIAEKIREHVKVKECEVFAYLSLESDIIVLVMAISDSPTKLQVEACVREAEKLKALIQQHSPTLLTELPLSFFSTATMIPSVSDSAAQLTLSQINLFIGLFVSISVFHMQRIFLSI